MNITMNKEIVGKVTETEKEEIRAYFTKKMALIELSKSLSSEAQEKESPLYERIVTDLGNVQMKMDTWWSAMAEKYKWKGIENGHWEIDFNNNDILLCSNPG